MLKFEIIQKPNGKYTLKRGDSISTGFESDTFKGAKLLQLELAEASIVHRMDKEPGVEK